MARKIIRLPSMSRVVAGATAMLELPKGPTYYKLVFRASGTALAIAHIGQIRVMVDGKAVQTFKNLQRLMDINGYYGREADTVTEFAIHLYRPELVPAQGTAKGGAVDPRRLPAFGTQDVQTFTVEMDLAAGAPADIAMSCRAFVDPTPQPLGIFTRIREIPYASAVAGQVEIDKLVRGPWYQAIHLFKSDVTAVEVEVDTVKIIDGVKADLERIEKGASPVKRVPVTASATHIDFVTEGDMNQALQTDAVNDFRVRMTLGTSGAVDIVTETLDTLEGA
jgi:hypothetical protein